MDSSLPLNRAAKEFVHQLKYRLTYHSTIKIFPKIESASSINCGCLNLSFAIPAPHCFMSNLIGLIFSLGKYSGTFFASAKQSANGTVQ